ncbi:MAG: DUF2079 domain-containing protein [Candidatus Altiarchaeota archaeon]
MFQSANNILKNPRRTLTLFAVAYFLLFSTICFLKYVSFSYGYDLTAFNQVVWATSHGNLFYSSLYKNNTFLSEHFSPILLLFAFPYKLIPHPLTLLALQTLALTLGVFPLYRIAEAELGVKAALVFSLSYLLYPPLHYLNLAEFHTEIFAAPLLLYAFYHLRIGSFSRYILFILLAMSCKENIPLVTLMFSFYALYRRMTPKWWVSTFVLSVLWFYLATQVVIPHYLGASYKFYNRYSTLGDSPTRMASTLAGSPFKVLGFALMPEKILYLLILLSPLAFLSLASPVILLGLPIFAQNLLADYRWQYAIYTQYHAALVPFLFLSAVYGVKRLSRFIKMKHLLVALLAATLVSNLIILSVRAPPFSLEARDAIAWDMVSLIPSDASVSADHRLTPALSGRYHLHLFNRGGVPSGTEYLIIDYRNAEWPAVNYRESADSYISSWNIIRNESGFLLLQNA